jgi:YVTN family beta-propeller protein
MGRCWGRWLSSALLSGLLGVLFAGAAPAQDNYTLFESGPVRPLALSPDKTKLFACNIPDGRLEIFSVSSGGLTHIGSVPVGLEPVAVAARSNTEVWVVNHLSDSISIVDVPTQRVTRTLLVGDEPRDIVFAGPGGNRAFITAAHRGQNRPGDPQLLVGGVGRSDVWVFDATSLGAALGGTPVALLNLFGDTPRALAVSPDGGTVYAAVFHSGDQNTVVVQGALPTPPPTPDYVNPAGGTIPTPQVGVMLKYQSGTTWVDVTGATHTDLVKFTLPDHDVFVIDANASTPVQTGVYDHVGTILYNMAVNPVSGVVYVSNTDANNFDRFEGGGDPNTAPPEPNLRGELHHARISILSGSSTVATRHLNKHIDYSLAPSSVPASTNQKSLGIPTDMAVTSNGATLYVAAFGSQEIGIIDTVALALPPSDPGAFTPDAANHIHLSAGGPGGLVLDQGRNRLYAYTRFDDGISIVDPTAKTEVGHLTVHNPESATIVNGRRFLYDTHLTSANGEASCAVCHVFADFDSLAWDLGLPDPNGVLTNNNPFVKTGLPCCTLPQAIANLGGNIDFHPLKGPMTTQTLRGMEHDGPMHWRGDRSGGTSSDRQPNWDGDPTNALDESQGFQKFNPAFVSLLGRASQLSAADMLAYTNFILKVQLPPNPIRNFDQTLTTSQATGAGFYAGPISDTLKNCNGCHTLDPSIGAFGTSGLSTFEGLSQHFKVPHLRNAYQKVGMYGMDGNADPNAAGIPRHGNPGDPQIRGFGYLNDGSVDNVVSFLNGSVFSFPVDATNDPNNNFGNKGATMRQNVANFVMAFPSDLAPIVGQQVTLTAANSADSALLARLTLLEQRAMTDYPDVDRTPNKECDLVVKAKIGGVTRGWWLSAPDTYTPDSSIDPTLTSAQMKAQATSVPTELTFTCTPPGSGPRMGIDRGGVGDSSQPDGIRDANQCGDVNADGIAANADVRAERELLAQISTPAAPGKCNVAGPNGSGAASCDIVDVAVLRRALASLGPALTSGCNL